MRGIIELMCENQSEMRKIEASNEFSYLPLGSVIRVIWHKSDCHEKNPKSFGVIYGDKIGWEDGSNDNIHNLIDSMNNGHCEVYLNDDKALALEHLYQFCEENVEKLSEGKISDISYGGIIAFIDIEHKIIKLS